ncbi:MAG: glycosyltransferase [Puniceicoccales bacterium]|jgi:glycosyltransferase involved in cell wall biosynthesis|nr:glycosyltransferase [Puniceicoccales bacterium]
MENFKLQSFSIEPRLSAESIDFGNHGCEEEFAEAECHQPKPCHCGKGIFCQFSSSGVPSETAQSTADAQQKNPFSMDPKSGAALLQEYLDGVQPNKRYQFLASLMRKQWKWFCRAAPYFTFPEPKPLREGEPIRIAFRTFNMTAGGIARIIQTLANHFADGKNYHISILVDESWMDRIDYKVHPNVELIPVKKNSTWENIFTEHPQDLVVCPQSGSVENFQMAFLLKFLGIRVLMQEHGGPYPHFLFNSHRERLAHLAPLYGVCDAVSCLTTVEVDRWRKKNVANSIYLPNPPTFRVEDVEPAALDSQTVLWVGRWEPVAKRPQLAIEAFAKILEKVPSARLVMLGTNTGQRYCATYERCVERIRELGIGHAVEICGFQCDLPPHYSSGALLMNTSLFEGFPMAIFEAKTFGLPVVTMAMPYVEVMKRGGCIQVPQGDVDALANAAIDLLLNGEKRKKLGAEARNDVEENFSYAAILGKYEALFDAIFKGKEAVRKLCARAA